MKGTYLRIFEIFLCIAIIVCVFFPFVGEYTPFWYAYEWLIDSDQGIIMVTIPLTLIVPLFLLYVFQPKLKKLILKVLKIVFMILFVIVYSCYLNEFFRSNWDYEFEHFLYPIFASSVLILTTIFLNVKGAIFIQNTVIATMTLPFVFHFPWLEFHPEDMKPAGWIMEGAFVLLYLIGIYKVVVASRKGIVIK